MCRWGDSKDSRYNGAAVPVAGQGRYFALNRDEAGTFGPRIIEVTQSEVVQNPLVIDSDTAWRALTKEAGWTFPNPYGQGKAVIAAWTTKLRETVMAKGHDGLVIEWNDATPYDMYPDTGKGIKVLRLVFDVPQVVSYRENVANRIEEHPDERTDAALPGWEGGVSAPRRKAVRHDGRQADLFATPPPVAPSDAPLQLKLTPKPPHAPK